MFTPQVGSVMYLHNPEMCQYKSGGQYNGNKKMKHPHVIIDVSDNGKLAALKPFSSKGDVLHEKNVHHFIPPEDAPGLLCSPSWVLPKYKDLIIPVSDLYGLRQALLTAQSMDIIFDYCDIYEDDWIFNKADAFIPFAGCDYPFSEVKHLKSTTSSVFAQLGMEPKSLYSYYNVPVPMAIA